MNNKSFTAQVLQDWERIENLPYA